MHGIRIGAGALVTACAVGGANVAAADVCGSLTTKSQLESTVIVSATAVAANAEKRLPEFCEVQATISPVAGSKIGAVYRLPVELERQGARAGRRRVRRQRARSTPRPTGSRAATPSFRTTWATRARARSTRRSRSTRRASATSKASSTSGTAPRTSRRSSARRSRTSTTAERRSARTGRAARRAAGKGSRKCNAIPTTTTA